MIDLSAMFRTKAEASGGGFSTGFIDIFSGRRTNSGEKVSPSRALTLSAYYACLRVISEDTAKLPLEFFKRKDRGHTWLPDDSSAILFEQPNPEMTGYTFIETLTHWACGWGNGYAEIVRNGMGEAIQLWPIHPSRVEVVRKDGKLFFNISNAQNENIFNGNTRIDRVQFPASDIFHIHGLGNGITGYSIAAYGAESIGLGLAAETFGATFFSQGSTSSGILTHPGVLGETAKVALRESWQKTYGGAKQAHKIAVLEEGLKFEPISIPPEQAQFLETRQFQVEEICRWCRVAPHKIQHLLHATFSNIEHQGREHVTDTLLPWLKRWTTEIQRQIIKDRNKFAAFDVLELSKGDTNARANYLRTMVNIGALNPNEVREMEDLNPIASASGDQYYMQTNMTTLDRIVNPPEKAAATEPKPIERNNEDEMAERNQQFGAQVSSLHGAFLAEANRVLTKEAKATERAIEKPGLDAWAASFYAQQTEYLVSALSPLVSALCDMSASILGTDRPSVDLQSFALNYCNEAKAHLIAHKSLPDDHTPSNLADAVIALVTEAPTPAHI